MPVRIGLFMAARKIKPCKWLKMRPWERAIMGGLSILQVTKLDEIPHHIPYLTPIANVVLLVSGLYLTITGLISIMKGRSK